MLCAMISWDDRQITAEKKDFQGFALNLSISQ